MPELQRGWPAGSRETRITKPVMLHTMMVSMKTSSMPMEACTSGDSAVEAAWAMGAEPRPASLEKTPRAMPMRMAIITEAPAKPPCAAVGVNASETTHQNTAGTRSMCMQIMIRHMMT